MAHPSLQEFCSKSWWVIFLKTINRRFWLLREYRHCLFTELALCGVAGSMPHLWSWCPLIVEGHIQSIVQRQVAPVANVTSALTYNNSNDSVSYYMSILHNGTLLTLFQIRTRRCGVDHPSFWRIYGSKVECTTSMIKPLSAGCSFHHPWSMQGASNRILPIVKSGLKDDLQLCGYISSKLRV